ncbi:MAG: sulfurtransferase [Rhodospirillaceae bacterium]
MTACEALIDGAWLAARLDAPDIVILDATSFLPTDPRDAKQCFREARIPGARFFDINDIVDPASALSHAMPKPETFLSKVSRLGAGDGFKVVVYDANGGGSAAMRAWWMFRACGHDDVAVLNGGLPKWIADGHPVEDGPERPLAPRDWRHFTPREGGPRVVAMDEVLDNLTEKKAVLADARAAERYAGTAPEPRKSRFLGHVPGAVNLPHAGFFNEDKTMKSPEEIRAIFAAAGAPLDSTPLVAMCGTGVTACVVAFAAFLAGKTDVAVYDGSWEEWGNSDVPVATGPKP